MTGQGTGTAAAEPSGGQAWYCWGPPGGQAGYYWGLRLAGATGRAGESWTLYWGEPYFVCRGIFGASLKTVMSE